MKKNWINLARTVLSIGAFLYVSPAIVQAEGNPLTMLTDSVEIDVLSEDENKANILDIELNDTSIEIEVPSETQSNSEEAIEQSVENSAVNMELEDVIVDGVDVEVLPKKSESTDQSAYEENAVANVELTDTIVDGVDVEVLPEKSASTDKSASEESAVANVELIDTIVDGVDVEVLPEKSASTNQSASEENAVANVELTDTSVDGVDLEVLPEKSASTDQSASEENAVANVELTDTIVDGVDVEVLPNKSARTDHSAYDESTFDNAVVEVTTDDLPLLGGTHIGLLDEHISNNENDFTSSDGVAQIDLTDGLINDAEVDVLVRETFYTEEGTTERKSVISLEGQNELMVSPTVEVLTTESFTPSVSPVVPPVTPAPVGEVPNPVPEAPISVPETPNIGEEVPAPVVETPAQGDGISNSGNELSVINDGNGVESSWRNSLGNLTVLNNKDKDGLGLFSSNFGGQNEGFLPKTGSLIDGMLLLMLALIMCVAGVLIRFASISKSSRSLN